MPIILAVLLLCLTANAADLASVVTALQPRSGVPGTTVTMTGLALDKAKIVEVYLTDHRFNLLLKVIEQRPDTLVVRIPPFAKVGRYQILLLSTLNSQPVLLEQPAYFTVEEGPSLNVSPASTTSEPLSPAPTSSPAPATSTSPVAAGPVPPALVSPPPVNPPAVTASAPQALKVSPARVSPAPPVNPTPSLPAPPEELDSANRAVAVSASEQLPEASPANPAPQPPVPAVEVSAPATPVQVLTRVAPPYPTVARQARITGAVKMRVLVDAAGKVREVEVLEGHPLLVSSAVATVKRWTYEPATVRSHKVASAVLVGINFDLH